MRNIFFILIVVFGCEQLEEQTAPLSGIFYVFEGWDEFMARDYDRAKELFSATLLADEGSETNWYPSMKIYRQSISGDWKSVFEYVYKDLKKNLQNINYQSD